MFKMKILLLLILLNILYLTSGVKQCELNLKPLRTRVPIIVKNDQIYYPKSEIIHFKSREVITLACPGSRNRFDLPAKNRIQAINVTCIDGKLSWKEAPIDFIELKCTRAQPAADIETTNTPCADGEGILKEISFRYTHNDVLKVIPLYKTCYNKDKWESLYAVHTIHGGYWQDVLRSNFIDVGSDLPKDIKLNNLYNQKRQNETISKIHPNLTVYWTKNYLARGHLAPCADFNYCTTQASSFYYINAAPQWQKFNGGNWLSIEYQVRNLVRARQEPLTVYTGGHDILKFKDRRGHWHSVFLAEHKKLPVPKYYWKVVYSPTTQEGIAFIGLNNIYTNSSKDIDDLCTNICQAEGYHMPSYDDKTKGLVTCCSLKEIKKKIPRMSEIPKSITRVLANVVRDRTYTEFLAAITTAERRDLSARFGKFYESFDDDLEQNEYDDIASNSIVIWKDVINIDPDNNPDKTDEIDENDLWIIGETNTSEIISENINQNEVEDPENNQTVGSRWEVVSLVGKLLPKKLNQSEI